MYLDGKPVLHIVDEATRFSAARFLPKMSTDAIWDSLLLCWSSVYIGLPDNITVDEGSQFRKIFAELAALHDVNIEKSGVESHKSLGIGERYHKPLRDTYRKLQLDYPSMQRQLLLALAVKSMNGTLGAEGIVPSALVFGEFPRLRSLQGPVVPRPSLAERAEAAQQARRYTSQHLAKVKVKRAIHHNTPPASERIYQPGDEVLIWREKQVESRMSEWIGPYTIVTSDSSGKIIVVQKEAGSALERFNTTQVKPFLQPEKVAIDFFNILNRAFSTYASKSSTSSYPHTPLEEYRQLHQDNQVEALERRAKTKSIATSSTPNNTASAIQVTEIIDKDDPRASSIEMKNAIKEEVGDLLRRGTFKVILKEELPDGANALTARFVLAIKSNADRQVKYKDRYIIGGHRDNLKHYMVHGAQTLRASSSRLLLALAAAHDFEVWTSDVKLAYLQSTKPIERRVFVKNPAPEFELEPSECFELLRPLYGLYDAGDLWHESLNLHLTQELKFQPTKIDPSLYFSFRNNKLVEIHGSYVDDLLRTGDIEFKK